MYTRAKLTDMLHEWYFLLLTTNHEFSLHYRLNGLITLFSRAELQTEPPRYVLTLTTNLNETMQH
jgi:hypothetical protein